MLNRHFTRKGPGRAHCFAGVNKKIQPDHMTLEQEYNIRAKCGALTETFWKRYEKQYKSKEKDEWNDKILKN